MSHQFHINGTRWLLELVDKVDEEDNLGECDIHNKRVIIKRGMSESDTLDTVCHEVIHSGDDGSVLSENFVRAVGSAQAEILKSLGFRKGGNGKKEDTGKGKNSTAKRKRKARRRKKKSKGT